MLVRFFKGLDGTIIEKVTQFDAERIHDVTPRADLIPHLRILSHNDRRSNDDERNYHHGNCLPNGDDRIRTCKKAG